MRVLQWIVVSIVGMAVSYASAQSQRRRPRPRAVDVAAAVGLTPAASRRACVAATATREALADAPCVFVTEPVGGTMSVAWADCSTVGSGWAGVTVTSRLDDDANLFFHGRGPEAGVSYDEVHRSAPILDGGAIHPGETRKICVDSHHFFIYRQLVRVTIDICLSQGGTCQSASASVPAEMAIFTVR